ncbi:MAG: class I SAM-dependent methyltransferase [Hamadaea sp.]|uniref:class I SAM-dependent methyltransferase n=1 Tax=Hamadaea sp. TaxID=2024425 RepID=UPI00181B891D|nr:class I SAM-dependent methyltransferase [Hamadaea sp.]NUR70593.1 class I SAM-dependent methyltransferase [Hamadaea sp.]NUT19278.1 class I SAM-dependent methyltransferase [Hamadaea sp.]
MRRPLGEITRGTTNPNRLRRVDRWIAWRLADTLASVDSPLVVDLGYGATPITAVELADRLARFRPHVVGLEIDPVRVTEAQPAADPPRLEFRRGGFELAGLRPQVVRAFNVLRQYDESAVQSAWETMCARLAPGGWLVEGTCDELGRIATWALLGSGSGVPESLTLAAKLSTLESPAVFAERLPKALIHHNVPGSPVHSVLEALSLSWERAAPMGVFGPRQRWLAAVRAYADGGNPVLDGPHRWRLGELTIPWPLL